MTPDDRRAWMTLQEHSAMALIHIAGAYIRRIVPSGYKDRNIARQGLDASDRDDAGFQEETRVGGSLNAVLGTPGKKSFAFIGPERMGGITVCDVTHPTAPHFVTYTYPPERTRGATWDQRGSSSCPRAVRVIDTERSRE
ncbi:MAG: hypothetical protein IPK33_10295 [Gemmatimonadetes bacterium]|nr:hypothetical protein [Gemmatimonadota bacterium]